MVTSQFSSAGLKFKSWLIINFCLLDYFRDTLPQLRNNLQTQLIAMEKDVAEYKNFGPGDKNIKTKAMLQ